MKNDFKKNVGFVGWAILLIFLDIKFSGLPVSAIIGIILGIVGGVWFKKNKNNSMVLTGAIILAVGSVIKYFSSLFSLGGLSEVSTKLVEMISTISNILEMDMSSMTEIINKVFELLGAISKSLIATIVVEGIGMIVTMVGMRQIAYGVKDVTASEEAEIKLGKAGNNLMIFGILSAVLSVVISVITLTVVVTMKFTVTSNGINVEGLENFSSIILLTIISLFYFVFWVIYLVNLIKTIVYIFKTQESGEQQEVVVEQSYN